MCVHLSTTFRITCPETGLPIDGSYDDTTGKLDLMPAGFLEGFLDEVNEKKAECVLWCIRSEASSHLAWSDARLRLIARGVKPSELEQGSHTCVLATATATRLP